MTSRVFSGDLQGYGRGRQHDSSSSRESSPTPGHKRKRAFSPGSDDGEPHIPPIADDDTPPPAERPLIRQGLAFTAATTSLPSSSVYKATPPDTTTPREFLPGMNPVMASEPHKKTATKRKKKDDLYKGQSGRFRLETYNSTPSEAPPLQAGPGPYASAFRGYSQRPSPRSESPSVPEHMRYPSASASTLRGSPSPAPMPASLSSAVHEEHHQQRASRSQSIGARTRTTVPHGHGHHSPSVRRAPQIRLETPAVAPIRVSSSSHLPTPGAEGFSPTFPPLSSTSSSTSTPNRTRGSYYRQDYETGLPLVRQQQQESVDVSMFDPDPYPPSPGPAPRPMVVSNSVPPQGSRPSEGSNAVARTRHNNARIVTILAQDTRSGMVDHQLIELTVPVRPTDLEDPRSGYWADARELLGQWQQGPARVDGPALVFTLRGIYRQILLRVSANNEEHFISGSIVLDHERTVHVFIENLPTPGVAPPPPNQRRRDSFPNPRQAEAPRLAPAPGYILQSLASSSQPQARLIEGPTRRLDHRSSDDDYDEPMPDSRSRQTSSPPQRPGQDVTMTDRASSSGPLPPPPPPSSGRLVSANIAPSPSGSRSQSLQPRNQTPSRPVVRHAKGYESPCSGDEQDKIDFAIRKVVDGLIQRDDKEKWKGFFKLKAGLETASNMVARYRFVQDLIDKYVGQAAPFKSTGDYIIEEKHIIGALMIEDSDGTFASNCKETLDLISLYGQGGRRCEDPEVIKLLEEKGLEYNAKPIKRLLRLLREADTKWCREHPPTS